MRFRQFIFSMIALLLVLFITTSMMGIFYTAVHAENNFETWYVGTYNGLNCRQEPNTNSEVLTIYPHGTELQIIGIDETGKWWQTWDGIIQGWCYGKYFVSDSEDIYRGTVGKYLGTFHITGYTPSVTENGGYSTTCMGDDLWSNVGQIVAVDPNIIPLNKTIYIEGIGYRKTRDIGVSGRTIDVLTSSNSESYAITGNYNVYIVE